MTWQPDPRTLRWWAKQWPDSPAVPGMLAEADRIEAAARAFEDPARQVQLAGRITRDEPDVEWGGTVRGFGLVEIPFHDYRGTSMRIFEIQESSLADERRLWVGPNTLDVVVGYGAQKMVMERAHLDEETVRKVRDALTNWLDQ